MTEKQNKKKENLEGLTDSFLDIESGAHVDLTKPIRGLLGIASDLCLHEIEYNKNLSQLSKVIEDISQFVPEEYLDKLNQTYSNLKESGKGLDSSSKSLDDSVEKLVDYTLNQPDQLTGLPANGAVKRHFKRIVDSRTKDYRDTNLEKDRYLNISYLFMDIDDFRQFNDKYGHSIGDEVLKAVGQKLNHRTKHTDIVSRKHTDIVSRCGGEEINGILPDTELAGAIKTAKRLVEDVAKEPIEITQKVYRKVTDEVTGKETLKEFKDTSNYDVSISCGVSTITVDLKQNNDIESLYTKLNNMADDTMYDAKNKGKNRFEVYNPHTDYVKIKEIYNCKKNGLPPPKD